MRPLSVFVLALATAYPSLWAAEAPVANEPIGLSAWHTELKTAYAEAQKRQRPVLVLVSASWCGWCHKLKAEMQNAGTAAELTNWVLAELDGDDLPAAADRWAIRGLPALRGVSASGRLLGAQDGYAPSDKLVEWLRQQRLKAQAPPLTALLTEGPPSAANLAALMKELDSRETERREAAIRKLSAEPDAAATAVVNAFVTGSLQVRLAALEILVAWKAPAAELDPWRPETVTADRMESLVDWSKKRVSSPPTSPPPALSPAQMTNANVEIDQYLAADDADAPGMRERLARLGPALLPIIAERSVKAEGDVRRERLAALRYRTAASASLSVRWPSGIERLAATDGHTRRAAAEELLVRLTPADEPLLKELTTHVDPLVKEIAVRGLQKINTPTALQAMGQLLADPDPNVRAAVLKQLTESKKKSMIATVAAYVATEKDADLVGHAVRYLKAAGGADAVACLRSLQKHANWSVRAEATEALGGILGDVHYSDKPLAQAATQGLKEVLDDPDGFVVSRALQGLKKASELPSAEAIQRIADRHPDVFGDVVQLVETNHSSAKSTIEPAYRKLANHPSPVVRANVLRGLIQLSHDVEKETMAGLTAPEREVRIAAAKILFESATKLRPIVVTIEDNSARIPVALPQLAAPRSFLDSVRQMIAPEKPVLPNPPAPNQPEKKQETVPAKPLFDPIAVRERFDAGLRSFGAGFARPDWMAKAAGPLAEMVKSTDESERLWAALALLPLGKTDDGVTALKAIARSTPTLIADCANCLGWLPFAQRKDFVEFLLSLHPDANQLTAIGVELKAIPDLAPDALAWLLLSNEQANAGAAESVLDAIDSATGSRSYDRQPLTNPGEIERNRYAARMLSDKAMSGPEFQRLAAMLALYRLEPMPAIEVADKLLQDKSLPKQLHNDAFLLSLQPPTRDNEPRLVAQSQVRAAAAAKKTEPPAIAKSADQRAIESLERGDVGECKIALAYLAGVYRQYAWFRNEIYLSRSWRGDSGETQITVPAGLTIAMLKSVRSKQEEEGAAYADYLLTLLGDKEAIESLIKYWRTKRHDQPFWKTLVARAIARLDNPKYVPVLEEIYATLDKAHETKEFYSTIRSMRGPEILEFRKRIRGEGNWQ